MRFITLVVLLTVSIDAQIKPPTNLVNQLSGWLQGGYGDNDRQFAIINQDGRSGLVVTINNYKDGDAKWYPPEFQIESGKTYTTMGWYRATRESFVTIQYKDGGGNLSYVDIGNLAPSEGLAQVNISFTAPTGMIAATFFHRITGVGSLTIADYVVTQTSYPKGMVTLRFDDGWKSQYNEAYTLLRSLGLPASFYIISRMLGDNDPTRIDTSQLQDLVRDGFEIGVHTKTHADLTLPTTNLWEEVLGAREDLISLGLNPDTFAYPFGAYDERVISSIRQSRFFGATTVEPGLNNKLTDPFRLRVRLIELGKTTPAVIKGWVDEAEVKKLWLIILFHQIDSNGGAYSITPNDFREVIFYLANKKKIGGIEVVSLREGLTK